MDRLLSGGRAICACRPTRIFKVRPDGTDLTQISRDPSVEDVLPSWSPDGERIAFTRFDDEAGLVAIYVMRADGTRAHQVPGTAELGGQAPAWSPDGTSLVFDGGNKRGAAVFTIRSDGITHLFARAPLMSDLPKP